MIAETLNPDKRTVRKVLYDELNMKKVCVKLVLKNLTRGQNLIRQQICSTFFERLDEEPELMENIIIFDETKIFQYYAETKLQYALQNSCTAKNEKGKDVEIKI